MSKNMFILIAISAYLTVVASNAVVSKTVSQHVEEHHGVVVPSAVIAGPSGTITSYVSPVRGHTKTEVKTEIRTPSGVLPYSAPVFQPYYAPYYAAPVISQPIHYPYAAYGYPAVSHSYYTWLGKK